VEKQSLPLLPLRKLQSHGVVMGNEALDKSSCILLGKGAAWPERIEFEAAVPSLDFTVALRVIRGGSDMGQSGQTVKSAFYARALLSRQKVASSFRTDSPQPICL
jgi:hypothetical protein